MRCPHCIKEDRASELHVKKADPIAGAVSRFWDKDGNLHVHDETVYRDVFSCTNGHAWMVEQKSRCPCQIGCEWNNSRTITPPPS